MVIFKKSIDSRHDESNAMESVILLNLNIQCDFIVAKAFLCHIINVLISAKY